MEEIGYGALSPPEQQAYRQFAQVFARYGDRVDLSGAGRDVDAMKVALAALGDHPQVVYFDKTQLRLASTFLGGREVRLCGAASPSRARAMAEELEARVREALERVAAWNPMTDYDKLLCLYEYIQDSLAYDHQELEDSCRLGRSPNPQSHNAYGALTQGRGVCDGIASAFCLLAQRMGFACAVVGGRASFLTQGFGDHAWNVLRLGNAFYHLDPTWDLNKKERNGEYSYEYFLVDDDAISGDHDWDPRSVPLCSRDDLSYYRHSRCYANNLTQMEEIFTRLARSKSKVVRARLAPGIPIPPPEDHYLGNLLARCAAAAGRPGRVRFTWNGGTRCFFAKIEA